MGLVKAVTGTFNGTMADQWVDFYTCDALDTNVLVAKGFKHKDRRSSNDAGHSNVITSGSKIVVADGQFMIITDQGAIVEACGEPGEYTWDASTESSIFSGADGELADRINRVFDIMVKRFSGGGDAMHDQRIYYFNTKEIMGNKCGTQNPIPFRLVDKNIGLDQDLSVRCNGEYSYRITNPLLFYKNVTGNDPDIYTRDQLDSQLRAELLTALQPVFSKISEKGIRYNELPAHAAEICETLNEELSAKWRDLRGIEIVSFAMNSATIPEEDQQRIKDMQAAAAVGSSAALTAGTMTQATADAMKAAAENENAGSVMAFAGLNMAANTGVAAGAGTVAQAQPVAGAGWTCECGQVNSGKFCSQCGKPAPEAPAAKFCSECGTALEGAKFCPECGTKVQ